MKGIKMANKSRHKEKSYPLRIPDELRGWVKKQAVRNERSLNSELKIAIKAYRELIEGEQKAA
jgi:hypothetical protein